MTVKTVYLIDDEPDLLNLLGEMVTLTKLKAHKYTQANHFFEEITEFECDSILVLDLNMPEMDGIEVMRRLATMTAPPALILVSGHDQGVLHSAEKLGRAHNLEIIASLSKPVSLDEFKGLLLEQIETPHRKRPIGIQSPQELFTVSDLERAILENQLVLYYQPQYHLGTGDLLGAEALVRWQHPKHGLISPDNFIPIAEQSGLIRDLTRWVIDQTVQQQQIWQDAGLQIVVSVNVSAKDITSLTLPEQLADLLADKKLDPTRLVLEVTESALMGELVTSLDILTRLRLKGIGLSIDDFGTGYSSLLQLHRVPFTELKIDRSFVSNMGQDKEARAIVKTCIILGHELNMTVLAEGVETAEQLKILKELGCDAVQGYFCGRPVPPEKIAQKHGELA